MPERPNILWIVTTQWRAQATGYCGDANARTPWLDGLASESIDFAQAVSPHPLGPQARAALLTGRLCPANGVADYWDPLPDDARTIAHAMQERGYATAYFGKWHLARRERDVPLVGEAHAKTFVPSESRGGFDFWEGFEGGFLLNDPWLHGTRLKKPTHFLGYQADVLAQRAAEWMKKAGEVSQVQPFFCVVSLESPHPPYHAPAPRVEEMKPAEIALRSNVPTGGPVEAQAREELPGYYAHIEATDRALGKLIAEVDLANTVVAFTSVHGDMHGSHGLFRKAWPYEESIRVPLLVRHGGAAERARRDDSTVTIADLPHMTLAWADGQEWTCPREHAAISMPTATQISLQCPDPWRGFRTRRHKLVLRADGSPWLFFDLENDPLEQLNLADDPACRELVEQLKTLAEK